MEKLSRLTFFMRHFILKCEYFVIFFYPFSCNLSTFLICTFFVLNVETNLLCMHNCTLYDVGPCITVTISVILGVSYLLVLHRKARTQIIIEM